MAAVAEVTSHIEFDQKSLQEVSKRTQKTISIVDYDPSWPQRFVAIRDKIADTLGSRALEIRHIGSTSILGLPAKDIIDVEVVVADPKEEDAYAPDLQAAGFQLLHRWPSWYEHRFFGLAQPYANVHIWGPNCPAAERHRIFQDWLRDPAHESDRLAYVKAKREAAEESRLAGESTEQYNERKQAVIREILDKAFRARGLLP